MLGTGFEVLISIRTVASVGFAIFGVHFHVCLRGLASFIIDCILTLSILFFLILTLLFAATAYNYYDHYHNEHDRNTDTHCNTYNLALGEAPSS